MRATGHRSVGRQELAGKSAKEEKLQGGVLVWGKIIGVVKVKSNLNSVPMVAASLERPFIRLISLYMDNPV